MYHWFDELIINGHIDKTDAMSMDKVRKSVKNISDEGNKRYFHLNGGES